MRSLIYASALVGLVAAAPAPQDIDFDLAYALPNPTYSEAVGATAQTVTYDPTTVYSAAVAQITASQTDTSADVIATTDAPANQKRAACATQPAGSGPIPSPDSASAFAAYGAFASAASSAPIPSGYTQQFVNLNGSNNAYGYMGYTTLTSYDVNACAAKCNAINGCISINVYFERDPTVDPGNGNSGCANPASTTNIKCVFWGGPVSASNAVNYGQWRNQFQVVIAGSNGYTNNSVAAVPGYTTATPLGNAAINAPYDKYGFNTFMGDAIFLGAFNAQLCAAACTQKSQYALAHPPTDGTPVQTCQFFNTYILYINKTSNVQGQYCAMYSETWAPSYATNVGQYRGNDHFMIEYSFTYSNATNPGVAAPLPAVYQARNDALYPGNSALPYCSSILGYTTPVTTSTATVTTPVTVTVSSTSVITATATTNVLARRQDGVTTVGTVVPSGPSSILVKTAVVVTSSATASATATVAARAAGLSEPAVFTKYPASIVSSGCALAATPVTSTSTSVVTATVAAVPVTNTVVIDTTTTATVTQTQTPLPTSECGTTIDLPYDGVNFYYNVICNVRYISGANNVYTYPNSNYQSCSQLCGNDANCLGFQIDQNTAVCSLLDDFTQGPYANLIVNSTGATGVVFGYLSSFLGYTEVS